MNMRFLQVFGDQQQALTGNQITQLSFNQKYLAVGQNDGSLILFYYLHKGEPPQVLKNGLFPSTKMKIMHTIYPFGDNFDYLEGYAVSQNITSINFLPHNENLCMVANQRTVQLLSITQKDYFYVQQSGGSELKFPKKIQDSNALSNCYYQTLSQWKDASYDQVNCITLKDDRFAVLDEFSIKLFTLEQRAPLQLINTMPTDLDMKYQTLTKGHYLNSNVLAVSNSAGEMQLIDHRDHITNSSSRVIFTVPQNALYNSGIYDFKYEDNKYYVRTDNHVLIYDARTNLAIADHTVNPRANQYQCNTQFQITVQNGVWCSGTNENLVQVGFNESKDIYQFCAKNKLKKPKSGLFKNVGGYKIVDNGERLNYLQWDNEKRENTAQCCCFGENQLAVGCNGNLYLYGWCE